MDPNSRLLMLGSGGATAEPSLGVEDVFSTWLYTGNGSTQTITNGIDLAGEGGMVWIKSRSQSSSDNNVSDTQRGDNATIKTNTAAAQTVFSASYGIQHLSTGFTVQGANNNSNDGRNNSGVTYASWTFRKAPGFFDVVTYTGDGTNNRQIAHNLGSVPGCIIVKRLNSTSDWAVYHRGFNSGATTGGGRLNTTAAFGTENFFTNNNTPFTSTHFFVNNLPSERPTNGFLDTYVAYLFAHDEQIFGENKDQSVIKCGSYTGTGAEQFIDLGWEPQWLLHKRADSTSDWKIFDNMRGWSQTSQVRLFPNLADAEAGVSGDLTLTSTGFREPGVPNGSQYIYIAIRRGPMKTPTDATEVFIPVATSADPITTGFPVDLNISHYTGINVSNHWVSTRLTGQKFLATNGTNTESDGSSYIKFDSNTRFSLTNWYGGNPVIHWNFRRAPGFFDVVAYTGTGVPQQINHNLGVAPELMIAKQRDSALPWYAFNGSIRGILNSDSAFSSVIKNFTETTVDSPYSTTGKMILYLFATLPGVSKVFSYTGNGTNQTINCGFTSGSRFVLIKRTDSTGNWLVADTARGIVSGNDPLLYLNSTAAEITTLDWLDPDSSGFIVNQEATANANVNGATYIGLAIA